MLSQEQFLGNYIFLFGGIIEKFDILPVSEDKVYIAEEEVFVPCPVMCLSCVEVKKPLNMLLCINL